MNECRTSSVIAKDGFEDKFNENIHTELNSFILNEKTGYRMYSYKEAEELQQLKRT